MTAGLLACLMPGLLHGADPGAMDLETALMSCTWSYHNPAAKGGIKDLRFWDDSAVTTAGDAYAIIGMWHATGKDEVTVIHRTGYVIKLTFGEGMTSFKGEDGKGTMINGERLEALLPKGAVPKMQPVAASISSEAGQAQIDIVAEQAPTITAGVIVPLDATALDHRAAVIALRDNLADEAVSHPVAPAATYQTAARLCNAWLISLDERDKKLASYGQARPSSIVSVSHPTPQRPGDYSRYFRELTEGHRRLLEDRKLGQFFSDAQKKQWTDRCIILKRGLEALHAQILEGLKQRADKK